MSGIHRNRCARCARSVDTDKCTHNRKCAGCSLALCSHCEHVAEEVAVFMCDHCTSVQSGGVGGMEDCGKNFRSLSKCCGHYVQYCLEHDDVDNPTDSWIGWQKGCLHSVPKRGVVKILGSPNDETIDLFYVEITNIADIKAVWCAPKPVHMSDKDAEKQRKQKDAERKKNQERRKATIDKAMRTYQVSQLLARRLHCGKDEYLVQWEAWENEYCEWVPAIYVNVQAIHGFNQPFNETGSMSLLSDIQSAEAAKKEFDTFQPQTSITIPDSKDMPFYNRRGAFEMFQMQRSVLSKYRSHSKKNTKRKQGNDDRQKESQRGQSCDNTMEIDQAIEPDEHLPKRLRQSELSDELSEPPSADASETDSVIDDTLLNDGTYSTVEPVRCSPAASLSTKRTTTDDAESETRSECASLEQLNTKAAIVHKLIQDAAKAAKAWYKARQESQDGSLSAHLHHTAVVAKDKLKPPKTSPTYDLDKLRLYTGEPPKATFSVALTGGSNNESKWLCSCGENVVLRQPKKVKVHLLTTKHLNSLKPIQTTAARSGVQMVAAVREHAETMLKRSSKVKDARIRACILGAQTTMSFTATSHMLRFGQSVVNDIAGGRDVSKAVIVDLKRHPSESDKDAADFLRKNNTDAHFDRAINRLLHTPTPDEKHAADCLCRLDVFYKGVGGEGKSATQHGPLRLDRTNVSRHITSKVASFVDAAVDDLIRSGCGYIGLLLDESKSTSKTDPCYICIVYCTHTFKWGYHLVGQTDASICTTGDVHLKNIKKVFTDSNRGWLWDLILLVATDGCSAMRSTRKYEGLHPRRGSSEIEFGRSFTARLQHELSQRRLGSSPEVPVHAEILSQHCVAHIVALALNDALSTLPPFVIPHIRSFHRVFNNKLKFWSRLKRICKELNKDLTRTNALIGNPVSDEALYKCLTFKSYSPTRWKDLLRVLHSILEKWAPLVELRKQLVDEGYGCPTDDDQSWDAPKRRRQTQSEESESDSDGDDAASDSNADSEEDVIDADDDHDSQDTPDVNGILPSVKNGGDVDWKCLGAHRVGDTGHCGAHAILNPNPSVAKTKRSTLLSDGKGLSALNHLIDSVLADIMQVHVDLVKRLEVRKQPIAHLIVRWIKEYHELLKTKFIDGTIYGPLYTPVRDFYLDGNGGDEPAVVAAVDNLGKNFADALRSSSMIRLKPYWPMLQALQLIDPSCDLPSHDNDESEGIWKAAQLLCDYIGIDYDGFTQQLAVFHARFTNPNRFDKRNINENLLRFYYVLSDESQCLDHWPLVRKYAMAVFTFPVTTVFVECLFSGMNLSKTTQRSSMLDDTCVAALKTRELTPVCDPKGVYLGAVEAPPSLDHEKSWNHCLPF